MNEDHRAALFFSNPGELRSWLAENHDSLDVQWIGLHKKATGRPSITWPELVDELLCFGWIDGLRRSIDEESYAIRVTPRRPDSRWSPRNLERMEALTREGRIEPPGLAAFEARDPARDQRLAEPSHMALDDDLESAFRANDQAWSYFQSESPFYRRTVIGWVMDAKRQETRWRRLRTLVSDCEHGRRIKQLRAGE